MRARRYLNVEMLLDRRLADLEISYFGLAERVIAG